jgi:hypothetical protein
MATKDPTPCNASSAVSLGFFMMRWGFKEAKLIEIKGGDKPHLRFRGWKRNYDNNMLVDMWDYYA